jgi:predicted  nucleic acid-binding Zn-ribbon protein
MLSGFREIMNLAVLQTALVLLWSGEEKLSLNQDLILIQKMDNEIGQHNNNFENMAQREQLSALLKEQEDDQAELDMTQQEIHDRKQRSKKAEDQSSIIEQKIKREENKLYSGTVSNLKEMMGIKSEIDDLKKQVDRMDTEILEQMETLDGLKGKESSLLKIIEERKAEIGRLESEITQLESDIRSSVSNLEGEVSNVRGRISEDVLVLYDRLRKEKDGRVVATVKGGACSVCNMTLPFEKVEKMNDREQYYRCEFCRRIIVIE